MFGIIYASCIGLTSAVKIESQNLFQEPAIHWQRACNIISAFSFNQNLLFPFKRKLTACLIKLSTAPFGFGSCYNGGNPRNALPHSLTPSLSHSLTPSLPHSLTPYLQSPIKIGALTSCPLHPNQIPCVDGVFQHDPR
jgi:hypothetical protein